MYIGDISFELFLIHSNALIAVAYLFARAGIASGVLRCAAGFALTVLLAQAYRAVARNLGVWRQSHHLGTS